VTKPKILYWDIETTHNIAATFPVFNAFINYKAILRDWHILSVAYSWEGEQKVHAVSVMDDPKRFAKDPHDDYHVIKFMRDLIEQADAVVAHNGDKFDMKKFNSRLAYHRLPPLPNVVQIDTLKIAKDKFGFTFNRLDYLARHLGVGRKIKTDEDLWLECLNGSIKALTKMVRYNKMDIRVLKRVYKIIAPFAPAKLNMNHFTNKMVCPLCGHKHVHRHKRRKLARAGTMLQYRCASDKCGHYFSVPESSTGRLGTAR
jgi:DNA polymerase III epsilon subunit-like protein